MSSPQPERIGDRSWSLFTVTWAAAVVFHLAGNTRLAPWWSQALIGASAVLVLLRPAMRWPALALALSVLVGVWEEAPILGNHWLLHGFLAVVVLAAVADPRLRGAGDWRRRVLGPARLTLLAFYFFAAFAKLNTDFFEPAVSCATFYLRESAASWGAEDRLPDLSGGSGLTVAIVVAAIECSVPVLLALRRTRVAGVVVGLVFHLVLALDRSHQFFDFSSVLLCLFLLFLPDNVVEAGLDRLDEWRDRLSARWESGPELSHLAVVGAVGVAVVVVAGPRTWPAPTLMRDVGVWVWLVYAVVVIVLVVEGARRAAPEPRIGALLAERSWLLVVPAIALVNGVTPYLEVKSAASWNMYANLAVTDGDSNHLIVRRGLPLTDAHDVLVEIVETDDAGLQFYVGSPWRLPEVQLVDYLADRPGVTVEGEVDGRVVSYEGGGSARPEWRQKFQVFRAVDADGPTSCQPAYGPAR